MPETTPPRPGADGRVRATPLARAVATSLGVDLATIAGSGRAGRIRRADVEAAAAAAGAVAPQTYLTVRVDAEPLLRLRAELGVGVDDLVARACERVLAASPASNLPVTVSDLGRFGVERFTAALDPPQAAVLAVGAAIAEPVATADGGVEVRRVLRLTLSIGHRALDGATGARFLQQLKETLEHPLGILD